MFMFISITSLDGWLISNYVNAKMGNGPTQKLLKCTSCRGKTRSLGATLAHPHG